VTHFIVRFKEEKLSPLRKGGWKFEFVDLKSDDNDENYRVFGKNLPFLRFHDPPEWWNFLYLPYLVKEYVVMMTQVTVIDVSGLLKEDLVFIRKSYFSFPILLKTNAINPSRQKW